MLTTSLYLFSSFLQADAAILALGAIFVVYKLQLLENRRQSILQHADYKLSVEAEHIVAAEEKAQQASILCHFDRGTNGRKHLEQIVLIHNKGKAIKHQLQWPARLLSGHLIASAILLWFSPITARSISIQWSIALLSIDVFAYALYLSVRIVLDILRSPDRLDLQKEDPQLQELVLDKGSKRT